LALAIEDSVASAAMNFIRSKAHTGIRVADVVDASGMSRSTLESSFKALLGNSVHGIIRSIQLERARHFISNSNLPMKEIAANTGFRSVQYMTSLFGKSFGQTPAKYRKG
jgi:LacI family transcriptional regulator